MDIIINGFASFPLIVMIINITCCCLNTMQGKTMYFSHIIIKYTQSSIMEKLHITLHSPACWRVTFDNPPLNLIDPDLLNELHDLINQFESAASELKVFMFNSANLNFYIAHVDILRAGETASDVGPIGLRLFTDFLQRLSRLPVISI